MTTTTPPPGCCFACSRPVPADAGFIVVDSYATRTRSATPVPWELEYYISQVKIILLVLGVNLLRSMATAGSTTGAEQALAIGDASIFELNLKKEGVVAHAREIDGEFTVLEGSQVRADWIGTSNDGYKALRDKLLQAGTITTSGDVSQLRFAFGSPSAAGAVIVGRSANGRTIWKVQDTGINYGNWQDQGVEEAAGGQSAALQTLSPSSK